MNNSTISKTNFMLSRVNIDIYILWLDFEKQYKGWVTTMIKNILIGLSHRMGYYLVANTSTIDEKVLKISLAS